MDEEFQDSCSKMCCKSQGKVIIPNFGGLLVHRSVRVAHLSGCDLSISMATLMSLHAIIFSHILAHLLHIFPWIIYPTIVKAKTLSSPCFLWQTTCKGLWLIQWRCGGNSQSAFQEFPTRYRFHDVDWFEGVKFVVIRWELYICTKLL